MKAANLTLIMAGVVYLTIAFSAIYLFGSNILGNFLDNMAKDKIWIGYLLQFFYLVLIACHTPYVFFAGKECFLVIVDEIHRRTLSKSLDARRNREKPSYEGLNSTLNRGESLDQANALLSGDQKKQEEV